MDQIKILPPGFVDIVLFSKRRRIPLFHHRKSLFMAIKIHFIAIEVIVAYVRSNITEHGWYDIEISIDSLIEPIALNVTV